ncbi:regulatory protein LuxR [Flammeovirgaceae bacterium 311]|nr:regulatory protein LuxR [Flammeovirgaceae bacterium 311]
MPYTPSEMASIFSRSHCESPDSSLFRPHPQFEQVMNQSCAYCFSIDYTSLTYIFISSGVGRVLGYEQKEWLEQGLSFFFKILHPEDREAMRRVHLDTMQIWLATSQRERTDLSFNFDYRVVASDGRVVRINQHTVFVEADAEGIPLVDFSVCTDISSYKSDGPVSLHIRKSSSGKHTFEEQHIIYDDVSRPIALSHRELEIIRLLSEGLNSRQVSQKLYISQHTVRTHRKNILKKTKCNSTVELVNLAKERGMVCISGQPEKKVTSAEQQKQKKQFSGKEALLLADPT